MRPKILALCSLSFLYGQSALGAQDEFFESRVRPVLAKSCYSCHGPDQQLSGLRVDSRDALLKGGKRGPSIVSGKPEESLLVKAIRHDGLKMPIGGQLRDTEIAAVEQWIRDGAVWPASTASSKTSSLKQRYGDLLGKHWAFQPVKPASPPEIANSGWAKTAIDRFVLAKMQKAGLHPSKLADKRVLLRRLSYVLTGLPPSAAEVERFSSDTAPDAYERLVDRLLASPHFGEHWARHWMDLVRFGETRGYEWNYEIIGAWRYRDYLIRAFNKDVPYDQMVREHIAGDLLKNPRIDPVAKVNESVIGTAFYRLGEAGHDDCVMFREIALDVIDNQIDTLTKTFQGLTVACARCHDHKLDPIPTDDYYGLYSILNSSRVVTHTIDLPEVNAGRVDALTKLKKDVRQELAATWKKETDQVAQYMLATRRGDEEKVPASLDPGRIKAWRDALAEPGQKLEDPAYPWSSLICRTGSIEKYVKAEAESLAARYRQEAADRDTFNREKFQPFGAFENSHTNTWSVSGNGLLQGYGSSGEFNVATEGETILTGVLPSGLYTNLLSNRLNGAVRSPNLPKDKKYISVRVMGGNLGARRTVIDNCAIGENYKVFENSRPAWVKLETFAKEARLPVFVELVTRSDNPRLPDRPEVLKPHQAKLLDDPRSYFGITAAVLHDEADSPKETLGHMLPLFQRGAPSDWKALAEAYRAHIVGVVERWAANRASDDDAQWLDWLVRNNLLTNRLEDATDRLKAMVRQYREVEAKIPSPRVVEGLTDVGEGRDFPVLIAGDAKTFGTPASRHFLREILGSGPYSKNESGRRELAETIASPANPLTARVMVNRIWHHVFGRGLVASVDNFGALGDEPSHPELLDYLAADFVNAKWSIKKMIRQMVLSETFRQSGEAMPEAGETDPQNLLLSHYRLRRLEAESVRDSILFTSGKLKDTMFGPSTDPHRDQPKDYRRLFSGPLDGDGRRSLYTKVTRMEGDRFLETFDYPNPMAARGSRDVTNVPSQALTMMNAPLLTAEAEACADRVLASPDASIDGRVIALFQIVLGRKPDSTELERFRGLAAELGSLHGVAREDLGNSRKVWKDLAHTLYNMKEFIYVQ